VGLRPTPLAGCRRADHRRGRSSAERRPRDRAADSGSRSPRSRPCRSAPTPACVGVEIRDRAVGARSGRPSRSAPPRRPAYPRFTRRLSRNGSPG